MARIGIPLGQLRNVLQCMKSDQRRAALQTLAPRVQAALVLFMETVQSTPAADLPSASRCDPIPAPQASPSTLKPSAASGISMGANPTLHHSAGSTYKAHVHIKALRFYTRGHHALEVALDRQMILVELCQTLSAASAENPLLWEDPRKTYEICLEVFRANGTSEDELGLSSYIYLRAGHWLVQSCTIISPVMPLAEALELHCRLLRARRTSWQELRAEWVKLMQCSRHPLGKRKSFHEAEAIADAARASALKIQLERAANSVAKALDLEELRTLRRRKTLAQHQVREVRREARARKAVERRAMKVRAEAWKERRRWWRRSDLTIDDIMHGP